MEQPRYYLAQLNIARMRAPLDDPLMAGFVARLDAINAAADRARGFVWRLQADDGNATSIRADGDPRILVNMSVWQSIDALHDYVYRSDHLDPFRRRAEWFERLDGPSLVLWWIPHDSRPGVEQGMARLRHLQRHGPTAHAFTFKARFPPPESAESGWTGVAGDDG
jgi:hypothetical protein